MSPRKNLFAENIDADIASAPLFGVEMITRERNRQIVTERWSSQHDDGHTDGSLAIVAALYAVAGVEDVEVMRARPQTTEMHAGWDSAWPDTWAERFDKREKHPRLRLLAIAGALIAAEIDRLQRLAIQQAEDAKEFLPLPCPFCGTQPKVETDGEKVDIACLAEDCSINPTVVASSRAAAVGEWNRRPT